MGADGNGVADFFLVGIVLSPGFGGGDIEFAGGILGVVDIASINGKGLILPERNDNITILTAIGSISGPAEVDIRVNPCTCLCQVVRKNIQIEGINRISGRVVRSGNVVLAEIRS